MKHSNTSNFIFIAPIETTITCDSLTQILMKQLVSEILLRMAQMTSMASLVNILTHQAKPNPVLMVEFCVALVFFSLCTLFKDKTNN